MKVFLILILFSLIFSGCKQDVGFSSVQDTELPLVTTPGDLDVKGPVVKIVRAPKDQMFNETNELVFEVIKGTHDIDKVTCAIDTFELPCDWLKGVLKLIGIPLGEHLFKVVAEDSEGLKGEAKGSWLISNRFRRYKETLDVSEMNKKSDILFVIDNSSSMRYEQTKISQRFDKFIEKIQGLDWQIAITTTDSNSSREWGDGKLVAFDNGEYILNSKLAEDQAQKLFAKSVQRKESGSDTEMGIYTTYRSIERSMNPKTSVDKNNMAFFREDATLSVVVVSDENEQGTSLKSDGDHLLDLVKKRWGANKTFQFNSIITYTRECLRTKGVEYGYDYEKLSNKTNGVIGDICANNYSQILKDIGQGVANLHKSYVLKCEPQDIDKDGKVDLIVTPKGFNRVPGYTLDKKKIEFDVALNSGEYEFMYFCID